MSFSLGLEPIATAIASNVCFFVVFYRIYSISCLYLFKIAVFLNDGAAANMITQDYSLLSNWVGPVVTVGYRCVTSYVVLL